MISNLPSSNSYKTKLRSNDDPNTVFESLETQVTKKSSPKTSKCRKCHVIPPPPLLLPLTLGTSTASTVSKISSPTTQHNGGEMSDSAEKVELELRVANLTQTVENLKTLLATQRVDITAISAATDEVVESYAAIQLLKPTKPVDYDYNEIVPKIFAAKLLVNRAKRINKTPPSAENLRTDNENTAKVSEIQRESTNLTPPSKQPPPTDEDSTLTKTLNATNLPLTNLTPPNTQPPPTDEDSTSTKTLNATNLPLPNLNIPSTSQHSPTSNIDESSTKSNEGTSVFCYDTTETYDTVETEESSCNEMPDSIEKPRAVIAQLATSFVKQRIGADCNAQFVSIEKPRAVNAQLATSFEKQRISADCNAQFVSIEKPRAVNAQLATPFEKLRIGADCNAQFVSNEKPRAVNAQLVSIEKPQTASCKRSSRIIQEVVSGKRSARVDTQKTTAFRQPIHTISSTPLERQTTVTPINAALEVDATDPTITDEVAVSPWPPKANKWDVAAPPWPPEANEEDDVEITVQETADNAGDLKAEPIAGPSKAIAKDDEYRALIDTLIISANTYLNIIRLLF